MRTSTPRFAELARPLADTALVNLVREFPYAPAHVLRGPNDLTPPPAASPGLLLCIPARFTALVLTEIETGLRWGELVALRPRHVDFLRRTITVEDTIVEVSKKISPTGERIIVKPYPKDDESRTLIVG